jgi:serine/threonine-protein kinase
MLTGELPFQAPSVPALLMKQISESPVPVDRKRPETPTELSQTVMRCLEKDPQDRWPTADALRRALETNTFTAAPPRAGKPRRGGTVPRSPVGEAPPVGVREEGDAARAWLEARRSKGQRRVDKAIRRHGKFERKLEKKEQEEREIEELAKRTGEPVMITRFRHRLATYAAVNGMLMLVSTVGGAHFPWYLVAGIWGIGIARDYARLWTSGYSWRDVINRPPAADAFEVKSGKTTVRLLNAPLTTQEFGVHAAGLEQARSDRAAMLAMLERMSKSERAMLPDIIPTVDQLLERATDLARSLASLEQDIDANQVGKIDTRLAALAAEPASADSERRTALLEQQKQKIEQLVSRRSRLGEQLESCLIHMQNMRFDLLRLRSSGVGDALGDLTQATQQARALSRDVDVAISAAKEIRKLTGNDDSPPPPPRAR